MDLSEVLGLLKVFFSELTSASVAVRLILATVMGGMIGIERAQKRYAAGIRTFALVCLGSALAMITALYLAEMSGGDADVGRIPGQVLTGIGFLGAGTIIVTDRKQIRGLTTAAGLWVTSTMGLAIGAGFIWAAVLCVILVLFTTWLMHSFSRYVESHTRTAELYIEIDRSKVNELLKFIREQGYLIKSMERRQEPVLVEGDIALRVGLDLIRKYYHPQLMDDVMNVEGVHYIEEIG